MQDGKMTDLIELEFYGLQNAELAINIAISQENVQRLFELWTMQCFYPVSLV